MEGRLIWYSQWLLPQMFDCPILIMTEWVRTHVQSRLASYVTAFDYN